MFNPRHYSFHLRALLLLGVCVLALGALPARELVAAVVQTPIDNTIADYGRGSFQRTSLGPLQNTTLSPKDLSGAIQLGPIGLLNHWTDSPFRLKKNLIRMGSTAIGNRLFVIGGLTPVGSATQSVADVWSAGVSQATGAFLEDWQAEPNLPALKGSNQTGFDTPVAEVNSPGVTSVASPGGGGYIYVIGGNAQPSVSSTFDFSSYAVRIGVVGPTGRITSWVAGPPLPSPDGVDDPQNINQLGIQSPAVQKMTINGKTYIYVIGGLRRYRVGTGFQSRTVSEGSKDVFYAQVGSGGQLVKPSNGAAGWDKLAGIPVPGSSPAGLWDATVIGEHYVLTTGESGDVLYLVGGQITPDDPAASPPSIPSFNATTYRAFVGANGILTWDFGWQGTLPQPRTGLSGVGFRGSLYAVGGIPNNGNQPDLGVLTSYVEDNMQLHQFNAGEVPPGIDGGGSNFLKSDALPYPRVFHGTALVGADASSANSAFVYVFGGRGKTDDGNTGDDQGSDTVFYGKIGGDENVASTGYATNGWYFSQPYDINFTGAQLQKIYWAAVLDRSAANPDIAFDYRISSSNSCANADWNDGSWQPLDAVESDATHTSANGANTSQPINLTARCFQYRAKLTTTDFHVTPSLLNVSIDLNVPGNPDLNPKTVSDQRGLKNTFLGLNVVIQNVNTIDPPTLPADVSQSGSFFVDLCIFGPGVPVVTPIIPFTPNSQCSTAYANIKSSFLGPNVAYTIPQWLDSITDKPVSLTQYFQTPGTYSVIAVVDSYNNINEGALGAENNNISQTATFTVDKIGYQINMPLVRR